MYEVDFLPVGDGTKSGDAIAMRFTRDDNGQLAHLIIDGGFQSNGDDIVEHVRRWYETEHIDIVILTHPDGDHIGGLGAVVRNLQVDYLLTHRPAKHGHPELDASDAVEDLVARAEENGTKVVEPFTGVSAFSRGLVIAGPTAAYYEQLLDEQAAEGKGPPQDAAAVGAVRAAWLALGRTILSVLPVEIPFDDHGGDNPRNNSSVITDIRFGEKRLVFTGDAGTDALNAAADYLERAGRVDMRPTMFDVPHHGSRRNLDSDTLTRYLGDPDQEDTPVRSAIISISKERADDPRYPSPRVVNGLIRRGCTAVQTAGTNICHRGDGAPQRDGYVTATPLQPQDPSIDDRE